MAKQDLGLTLRSSAPAFIIALIGGATFSLLNIPLPWTLGAIAFCAVFAINGSPWLMTSSVMMLARPTVGVMVGSTFSPEIMAAVPGWWREILFVLCFSASASAIGYILFRVVFRFDRVTAFVGALPAGLAELTIIGSSLGGNLRTLVLIHSVRIVTVVFTVPLFLTFVLNLDISDGNVPDAHFAKTLEDWVILVGCGLAGAALSQVARLPGGVMITALLVSAIVHGTGISTVSFPFWVVALAQILIGSVMGARFAKIEFREARWALLAAILWAAMLMPMAFSAARLATWLFEMPMEVSLLALAPGGIAEMSIVTYALGANVAFIVTCQVARMFFLLMLSPFIAERIARTVPRDPTETEI